MISKPLTKIKTKYLKYYKYKGLNRYLFLNLCIMSLNIYIQTPLNVDAIVFS